MTQQTPENQVIQPDQIEVNQDILKTGKVQFLTSKKAWKEKAPNNLKRFIRALQGFILAIIGALNGLDSFHGWSIKDITVVLVIIAGFGEFILKATGVVPLDDKD